MVVCLGAVSPNELSDFARPLLLGLSGYYQPALSLVRDVIETTFLLDYLNTNPEMTALWRAGDESHQKAFRPASVREALDRRDGLKGRRRKHAYGLLSELAAHPTASGFALLAPEGLGRIGPSLNADLLNAWVEEMAERLVHGAALFAKGFRDVEPPVLLEKASFISKADVWRRRYLAGDEGVTEPT